MLKSEGEVFRLIILMLLLVVGHQLLPTTLKNFTHMNHVHTTQILFIVLVIVHPRDKFPIFHIDR